MNGLWLSNLKGGITGDGSFIPPAAVDVPAVDEVLCDNGACDD
jgi:hypothetical protein